MPPSTKGYKQKGRNLPQGDEGITVDVMFQQTCKLDEGGEQEHVEQERISRARASGGKFPSGTVLCDCPRTAVGGRWG